MATKKIKVLLSRVFSSLLIGVYLSFIFLSTAAKAQVSEDMGITISPVKYEYDAEPGEVITGKLKFFNVTNSPKTIYLRTLNFVPIGETGYPGFISEEEDDYPYEESLKDWIELEVDQLKVDPVTDDRNIPEIMTFQIKVPENAAAGGHYAGIVESLKPKDQQTELEGSGMVITPESACLIILNVRGEVTRKASSEQFYVTDPFKKEKKPMKLFEYPPVMFVSRVRNQGNTHIKPQGNVFLYKGDKQIATFKINESEGNVLKDSVRRFEMDQWGNNAFITREAVKDEEGKFVEDDEGNIKTKLKFNWDGITKFAIGKYEARLALVYDGEEGKQVVRDSVTFWIIPWKLILLVILIVVVWVSIKIDQRRRKKGKKKSKRKTKKSRSKSKKSSK
jgi:hypothetical protein